jgi:DNA-binding transcriptional regulator YiaG
MMDRKVVENYSYTELGFPITLSQVEMIKVGDEYHPVIDVKKVAAEALASFSAPDSVITGNQLYFIRVSFQMDEKKFAKLIKSTDKEIVNWEKSADKPVMMAPEIENALKQSIRHKVANKENNDPNKLVATKGLFQQPAKKTPRPAADDDLTPPPKKPQKK